MCFIVAGGWSRCRVLTTSAVLKIQKIEQFQQAVLRAETGGMTTNQFNALAKVINVDDLMERCMGNLDFVEKILTIFQTRCAADLAELEAAIEAVDLLRVQQIAHRLKGACANAGANNLSERASELWTAANKGFTDVLAGRCAQFRQEWNECTAILLGDEASVSQEAMAASR